MLGASPIDPLAPLYRLIDVDKEYPFEGATVHALRSVHLEIAAGELLVLLGPSGSGKTTLLNLLGGLDRPSNGQVLFRDIDLSRATDHELTQFRRERLGFVFQSYNLASSLTAMENVRLATDIVRNPIPSREALQLVGMENRARHFPSQLSGGEQQRVAIARAIAKRPEVLLCDEPTGALDVETGIRVLDAIQKIHRNLKTTIVIITHNAVIGALADRVCTMSDGRIIKIEANSSPVSSSELKW